MSSLERIDAEESDDEMGKEQEDLPAGHVNYFVTNSYA